MINPAPKPAKLNISPPNMDMMVEMPNSIVRMVLRTAKLIEKVR